MEYQQVLTSTEVPTTCKCRRTIDAIISESCTRCRWHKNAFETRYIYATVDGNREQQQPDGTCIVDQVVNACGAKRRIGRRRRGLKRAVLAAEIQRQQLHLAAQRPALVGHALRHIWTATQQRSMVMAFATYVQLDSAERL